jgi:hypothetical protein
MADGYDDAGLDDEPETPVSPVRRVRQRHGLAGAALAGAMIAVRDILEAPKEPDPVTVEVSSEPVDIDADGIRVDVDEQRSAVTPPLAPLPAETVVKPGRKRRRRQR